MTTSTPVPLYWAAYGEEAESKLLILHGGPGADHGYLLPQMLELSKNHELFFYDQRGGGRSQAHSREPITWKTQVSDLAAVVHELRLEPLSLIGYSWGGLLSILYCVSTADHSDSAAPPSPPKRLVLIDPAPLNREYRREFENEFARRQKSEAIEAMRAELAASGSRERDPEAYRQRAFEISVAGYFANPLNARNLTPFRVMGRVQESVWESLGEYDLYKDLRRITCPTIIIHGRDDPIPPASSVKAAETIGAELVLLDDCGHVPYVEQPQALFSAINRFLDSTEIATR